MMGPYKGARESRRGYTRASIAFARREEAVAGGILLALWRLILGGILLWLLLQGLVIVPVVIAFLWNDPRILAWPWNASPAAWLPFVGVVLYLAAKWKILGRI
jgi:hypothetical protein